MKKFLSVVFVFVLSCSLFAAQQSGTVIRGQAPSGSFPIVKVAEDGTLAAGSSSSSGTPLQYWAVGKPRTYRGHLATSTALTFSNVASMAVNTFVIFQSTAKFHSCEPGVATATMQYAEYTNAGEKIGWRVATSTFDMSAISDTAAAGSYSLSIYDLY
jgi:hypothetical protein